MEDLPADGYICTKIPSNVSEKGEESNAAFVPRLISSSSLTSHCSFQYIPTVNVYFTCAPISVTENFAATTCWFAERLVC